MGACDLHFPRSFAGTYACAPVLLPRAGGPAAGSSRGPGYRRLSAVSARGLVGAGSRRELGRPTPGPASWGLLRAYGTLCALLPS